MYRKIKIRKMVKCLSSTQIVMLGFLLVIAVGSVLLSLPVSSADGHSVSYVDALFTATTATCVTGLVTLPTVTAWSLFGQIVILLLIQIGGIGVITVAAGLMMILKRKINMDDRILISESFNMTSLEGIVRFVRKVMFITLIIEGVGALIYMTVFVPEFGIRGIWISVFTSVSAFCNAGIDIIAENSLCDYVLNPVVNAVTMVLIVLGGIGFLVIWDIEKILKDKRRRHFRFLSLHSKIVLTVTLFLIVVGAALILILEYNNPKTIKEYSFFDKVMVSLFQSVTTRTAGFATVPQENLMDSTAFVSMLLMFVGGSPTGTAGGIKTTALTILIFSAVSVIKNKRMVDIFNRQISSDVIKKSVAVFLTSFLIVLGSTLMLLVFSGGDFLDILYEIVSATATVGLTRDFTGGLQTAGKLIVIITMYLGRVGPISLALVFGVNKSNENIVVNPYEKVIIG